MNRRTALPIALVGLLFGCLGDEPPTTGAAPTGCAATAAGGLFVTPDGNARDGCASATTLQAALADPGHRPIVLSEGTFKGPIVADYAISIVGAGSDKTTIEADGDAVIKLTGTGNAKIVGVAISGTAKAGILVQSGGLELVKVLISGLAGDGVHAEGSGAIRIETSVLKDNAGRGLYAKGTGPIAIIDPVYAPIPRQGTDKVGIIDPVYAPGSQIAGNKQGGIAIIDPVYSPKADLPTSGILVQSTLITGNGRYGIGLWSAGVIVQKSAIIGSVAGKDGPWADGIVVAKGATERAGIVVQVGKDSVVLDNARTGILTTGDVQLEVAGDVSANGLGGVWAQGANTSILVQDGAALIGNKAVGVVAAGGAALTMTAARVSQTRLIEVSKGTSMGDGVGIYNGSKGTITNAKLIDNERAAVVVHSAGKNSAGEADVVVDGCEMKGGQYTFVINGAPVPEAAMAAKNDAQSAGSGGTSTGGNGYQDNADLPVQADYCSAYSSGCTSAP